MKLFHLFVLTLLFGVVSPAVAKENFLCAPQSGDMSFNFSTVLIERDGKNISVFGVDSGKVIRDDRWAYQVFAENKGLGLQAIRTNPESGGASSTVAVEYGGLLFLIWGEGRVYAYVVSAQASTKKSESQVLACERR